MKRIKLASATVAVLRHAPIVQSRADGSADGSADGIVHTQSRKKVTGNMFASISDRYGRSYDRGNPSETCFDTLYESDANGDGVLQNYEYTAFIADLSDGDYVEDEYVDLPFALKVNFAYLSFLCRSSPVNGGENCCIGPESGIWLPPDQMTQLADNGAGTLVAGDDAGLDLQDLIYLNEVCSYTQGAIDYVRYVAKSARGRCCLFRLTSDTSWTCEFHREEDGITRSPTGRPTDRPTPSVSSRRVVFGLDQVASDSQVLPKSTIARVYGVAERLADKVTHTECECKRLGFV